MLALKLVSPSRPQPIVLDLTNPEALKGLKKDRKLPLKTLVAHIRADGWVRAICLKQLS